MTEPHPWADSPDGSRSDDDKKIADLAGLPPLAYERQRKEAAKALGISRLPILDRLVEAARAKGAAIVSGQGRPLELPEPQPWPEPVDGAPLLDAIVAELRRYVVLGAVEADAVALWVVAVHAFNQFSIFPRLFVTAPEKGCGKTTLLDVIHRLVPRPLSASSITAPSLFRTVEAVRPTLLLDEADTYARDNEELRGVLNSGHRRDGTVIRTVGDNHEPRQFSVCSPAALAAIGHLPGTIEDRSIIIRLRRRRPDEPVMPLRLDRAGKLEELARQASRWASDHAEALDAADPMMPASIYNRTADNWRPLLAVADLTSAVWSDRARNAAVELSADGEDTVSAGILLLADLRELFARESTGVLFTKQILAALHQDETRPWSDWKNGKPMTDRHLAALLKSYKIKPKTVRRGDDTEKGYKLEWFEDAFERYLAPRSVTASQMSDSVGFRPPRSVTPADTVTHDVTDEGCENASISVVCDAVTGPKPTSREEEAVWTG